MKSLFLIRHGHAHPAAPGLPDHARTLDERGRSEGLEMGRRLGQRGVTPDRVITSSAARARMTAELLACGMDVPAERLVQDRRIYASSVMNLLYLVRSLDDSLACVMLVGHNPEMTGLAQLLSEAMPDLPTCAVVAFDFGDAAWSEVGSVAPAASHFDSPASGPGRHLPGSA